jgi:chorismate mutase
MNLKNLRKKIDQIDAKLVRLIGERQSYMKIIGEYKAAHKIPIYQPQREKEILKKRRALGVRWKVDPLLLSSIFSSLFKNARTIQRKVRSKKKGPDSLELWAHGGGKR